MGDGLKRAIAAAEATRGKPAALTKIQVEVLRELATTDAHWMRYMGRFNPTPYWHLKGKRVTKQMEALISRGLAEKVRENALGDAHAIITEAGRAWLASGIVTEGGDAPAAPGAERLEPARTPESSSSGEDRG